ncbi:MAG: DUF4314 domain-containing protein [Butyrivibrio sp.]|nr:DUF4314 domain-containing protein [Butyrivibrio sp.]
MRFPSRETVDRVRKEYPVGTRVALVKMDDCQAPPLGTKGTVDGVDDTGSLLMSWDNGSGLNVVYGEDIVRKLDPVKVTCYMQTEDWEDRADAVAFYEEAEAGCDPNSHECQRYSTILSQLLLGKKECADE